MAVRFPTGASATCTLPQPVGCNLGLDCAITIQNYRVTVARLLDASLLDAAGGAFPWAAAAALIKGRLLSTACWLFQFEWQASAILALVSGQWVGLL